MTAVTDASEEFLAYGRPSPAYLAAMATAAAHVADAHEHTLSPTTAASYLELQAGLRDLAVAPEEGVGLDHVMAEVRARVLGDVTAVSHPDYVAHLHTPAILPALAAEVMLSAANQSMDSFDQSPSATALEGAVVDWALDLIGFTRGGDAVFTSGATQSNLQGLLLARESYARRALDWPVSQRGLPAQAARWRVLCSRLAHFSVAQSMSVLGLGDDAVAEVACDSAGRLDVTALRERVAACRRDGEIPIALVLTAGTTDLGSVDPLPEAIAVAREHGLWVHVDAAAGGCLLLSDRHRGLLCGLELADSVAIDFHKLLFQPISCGLFAVREAMSFELMRRHTDYLNPVADELAGTPNLVYKSLQTTRRFDSLKVFMTLRALGRRRVAELIDATVAAAAAAGAQAAAHPELELLAPVATNTVALRWTVPGLAPDRRDRVNSEIRACLSREGRALVGRTEDGAGSALKLTFVNPLCTPAQARRLVTELAGQGRRLAEHIDVAVGRTA